MDDSRPEAGKVQFNLEYFIAQKTRKCSKNDVNMSENSRADWKEILLTKFGTI